MELKIAFKGEPQIVEIEAEINALLGSYGYEPVQNVNSNVPGVKDCIFIKSDIKSRKSDADIVKSKEIAKAKKAKAKKDVKK